MNKKISVIGGGAWGTALASIMCSKQCDVMLYAREREVVHSINNDGENKVFLPGVNLPKKLKATDKLTEALKADVILLTTPAQYFRAQLKEIKKQKLDKNAFFLICTKGIENKTLNLMSEIFEQVMKIGNYGVLSGPTFASEVIEGVSTSISLACKNKAKAEKIKQIIDRPTLKVHVNTDIIGSQVCGAIKNVIAIGCGLVKGLKQGENSKAAIITQGFYEIMRVTVKMGGEVETLTEPCGIGDLVLTCNSEKSRNFSFGMNLAKKKKEDILRGKLNVVEGVATSKSVLNLSKKLKVKLPLCEMICKVIDNKAEPKDILSLV